MVRVPFSRRGAGFLVATGLAACGGCVTERVYEDETPAWIQQATGEMDLRSNSILADWHEDEPEESGSGQRQTAGNQPREIRPGIEIGPRKVTVTVEGEDY